MPQNVTVVDHRSGSLLMTNCAFRKTSPHATLYRGNYENLILRDNLLEGFEEGTTF